MEQETERTPDSSPIPFRSHTALLLSAALPFLQPSIRHPVELALKFLEFSETLKLYREFHMQDGGLFRLPQSATTDSKESGLFGLLNTFILDLEGLLGSLSKVCTGDEKELITMFLNLIRAKNFYETYGDLIKMGMMAAPEPEAEPSSSPAPNPLGGFPFPGDLTSMLSDDQKETLDLLKNLFSTD